MVSQDKNEEVGLGCEFQQAGTSVLMCATWEEQAWDRAGVLANLRYIDMLSRRPPHFRHRDAILSAHPDGGVDAIQSFMPLPEY